MTEQETLYTMALTRMHGLSCAHQHRLLHELGSARAVYEHRMDIAQVIPEATPRCREMITQMDDHLARCEAELAFAQKGGIQCIGLMDEDYPTRLRECEDAPVLLYYRGHANLNARHVLSIVGTRQITPYGKDMCEKILTGLQELCPDVLVISGLAYGVDIHTHRAALKHQLPTVGVLAHGLDQIYPRLHRDTAIEMLSEGGLLTEYMSGTSVDKRNFVARNRIVAGMCDAVLVIESASKGGSLITAEMAEGYHHDVMACPGRATDTYSEGCNRWIAEQRAHLVMSAQDIVHIMGWENEQRRAESLEQGIQRTLFPELKPEEQQIMAALKQVDSMHLNGITSATGLPISQVSSLLFMMEMRGLVSRTAGNMYRAI